MFVKNMSKLIKIALNGCEISAVDFPEEYNKKRWCSVGAIQQM